MILARLRNLIARFRADDVDEELVSLARRQFLIRTGAILALPVAAPLIADKLLELLPAPTIVLPTTGQVWAVNSLGGYFYSRQLSKVLILRFKQFADTGPVFKFDGPLKWDVYASPR